MYFDKCQTLFSNFTFSKLLEKFYFPIFEQKCFLFFRRITPLQFRVLDVKIGDNLGELFYLLIYGVESEVERIVIAKVVPGALPVLGKLTLGTAQWRRDRNQGEN